MQVPRSLLLGWLLLLVLARASTAQPYGPPYHTLNQEVFGLVEAARDPYGTTLTSSTLAAAVAAQGPAPHLLLLKCGTWTLTTSQVIPETLRLWVPLCTTVTLGAGAVLTLQAPPLVDQEQWWSGAGQVVLDFVVTPPQTAVGAPGSLQAADGLGGLAAYSGSGACPPGEFMSELLPTGLKLCGAPVAPNTTGHLLTDRSEPLMPNAVNLGALSSGLLRTTASGGIAAMTTVPLPAGALVGTDAVQTLTHTFVALRIVAEATNVTPVVIDLSNTDMTVISELLQNTLITDPIGSSGDGQLLWMLVHSTTPRLLTWSATWTGDSGIPLPSTTTGGSTFDLFAFLYNPITGKLILVYNSQLLRPDPASGVTPGAYTCPATLSVDVHGRITAVTSGTCGGGGSAPAGSVGDIQLNGGASMAADSGTLSHHVPSHTTYTQGIQAGAGSGYSEFTDVHGLKGWLFPSDLTSERAWKLPNQSGTLAVLSDITAGSGAAISGVPTNGQLATWINATTIQGVTALPATNFPALTGDCTTSAGSTAVACAPLKPMTTAGDMIYGGASGVPTRLAASTGFLYANGASAPTLGKLARAISFTMGSPTGAALTTSETDLLTIPFACTISAYTLLLDAADTTLRVKVIRVADGGTAIPTVGSNSISTSGWGVATGTRLRSTTLSDLTSTAIAKDDTVGLAISVANTAKMVNLTLQCDQ